MKNYSVSEGNKIGGQEPQSLGGAQARIKASADIVKGQILEITGEWTVAPAAADSTKVVGLAFMDAKSGQEVTVDTEGFVKLDVTGTVNAGDALVSAGAGKAKAKGASAGNVFAQAYTNGTSGVVYAKLRG